MIITRALILALTPPQEVIDWLDAQGLYGLQGIPFAAAVLAAGKPEYAAWLRDEVQGVRGIKQGAYEYFGLPRIVTFDGVEVVADLAAANTRLAQRRDGFKTRFAYAFSVNACRIAPNGDKTMTLCDLSAAAPAADFFEAFDYQTGQYIPFADFASAKSAAQAKQAAYLLATAGYFSAQRRIRRVGDTTAAWDTL